MPSERARYFTVGRFEPLEVVGRDLVPLRPLAIGLGDQDLACREADTLGRIARTGDELRVRVAVAAEQWVVYLQRGRVLHHGRRGPGCGPQPDRLGVRSLDVRQLRRHVGVVRVEGLTGHDLDTEVSGEALRHRDTVSPETAGVGDERDLRDAIEATDGFIGIGGTFTFSADDHNGMSVDDLVMYEFVNGAWTLAE